MPLSIHRLRRAALAATAVAGCLASAAPASASLLTDVLFPGSAPTSACAPPPLSQPFQAYGDDRQYALAPNGDFANGSGGWRFVGFAGVVSADRPGAGTGGVLRLSPGSAALSPLMCVDQDYPTARMWVNGAGGVDVRVVYPDTVDALPTQTVGNAESDAPGTWALSDDFAMLPQRAGADGWRRVAFLLVNTSGSTAMVDDLYVDPWMR